MMLKSRCLAFFLLLPCISSSQSEVLDAIRLHLTSKNCGSIGAGHWKRDSTGLIRGAGGYGYHKDSLVALEIKELIPLRPYAVDQGLEIYLTEEGMKDLLDHIGFKRKMKKYEWRLAYCAYPNAGIDPAQTMRAKEIVSVWFEVNSSNEIKVNQISRHFSQKKLTFIRHQPIPIDQEAFRRALIHHITAKAAVWNDQPVLALEVLWIYCPSNYWKKRLKRQNK